MLNAIESPYLAPFDHSFKYTDYKSLPPHHLLHKKDNEKQLAELCKEMSDLQRRMYAQAQHSLLLIFQAMDAGGKDSTIRTVMSDISPGGCQAYSFQTPSLEEYKHDFLWRSVRQLPKRGHIGIFNRSYYEEVLIVRVHPEYLDAQHIPNLTVDQTLWEQRLESIVDHEKHLARNGTAIVKFWLHISRDEQKKRFLSRIDEAHKNWKFSRDDIIERRFWDQYMDAYQAAIAVTSKPWAPWYIIPSDDKPYTRKCVADIIVATLRSLGLAYPRIGPEQALEFEKMRETLEIE